ncbi:MAG TPA: zinc-ribbon domain-containing protein, partial [Polyangia bacterium]
MKIICDSCGTKYSISDDKVRGKVFKIRCKKCSHIIVVRGGESQDEASAAPAAAAADG